MRHKILWDFEIQTDHLISTRRPDLVLINKERENLPSSGFCHSSGPQIENKKSKKMNKYLDYARKQKKSYRT